MNVSKSQAVALLISLGFAKAAGWADEKIISRLEQVPSKVKPEAIDDKFSDLYDALCEMDEGEELTFEGGEEDKAPEKEDKAEPDLSKMDRKALMVLAEDRGVKVSKKASADDIRKALTKETKAPPAKAAPAKKEKAPAKKEKTESSKKVERDRFGCALGTISHAVNKVLTTEWKDEADIVKEAGVRLDQARGRLYWGIDSGVFEHRRLNQYRIVKK